MSKCACQHDTGDSFSPNPDMGHHPWMILAAVAAGAIVISKLSVASGSDSKPWAKLDVTGLGKSQGRIFVQWPGDKTWSAVPAADVPLDTLNGNPLFKKVLSNGTFAGVLCAVLIDSDHNLVQQVGSYKPQGLQQCHSE